MAVSITTKKSTKGAATKKAPGPRTLGCCLIEYDDKREEQFPNKTKKQCDQLALDNHGTAKWNPGKCAER